MKTINLLSFTKGKKIRLFTFFAIVILLNVTTGSAQTLPAGFTRVNISQGAISRPTAMVFAPDGRLFVTQQNGVVRIIKNDKLLSTPFMSLSVNNAGEGGLIGITLDPNFSSNQYLYVYYTLPDNSRNRVSRFTASGDLVVSGSEKILINLDPNGTSNRHFGGALHFGKDGKLYISVGDNTNPANGQNLDTYFGKILRINPDGTIPAGNPFTSGTEQRKRIWSYGVRHAYTFAVQPGTGKIFLNDVGEKGWEEIDDATLPGKNFGWSSAEGNSTNAAFTNPVYAYPHGSGNFAGCAITGGCFFNPTSSNYPSKYFGKYFFQDHCNGWINILDFSGSTPVVSNFATNMGSLMLALDVSPSGNLYYIDISSWTIFKIVYSTNSAPVIITQPVSQTVSAGQSVTFSVTASGTSPLAYQWQKNGVNISGATASSYSISNITTSNAGGYRVIISNSFGSVTSNTAQLTVGAYNSTPVAQIINPPSGTMYRIGQTIQFSGEGTDAEDGTLPASAFTWRVDFQHDTHSHPGPTLPSGTKSGSFVIPDNGEVSSNVWYRIYLVVKDSKGVTNTTYRDIFPYKSTITLLTSPAGMQVKLDNQPKASPLSVESVEGQKRTIGSVTPQQFNGKTYVFDKWMHGGTESQSIITPQNDITYTVVYKEGTTTFRTPENPASLAPGINYSYYEGDWSIIPNFAALAPVKTGIASTVDLSLRNRTELYGFRFRGYIDIPADGSYTFYLNSDDGSSMYFGNSLLIKNDGVHGAVEKSGTINLLKGRHSITIDYFQKAGGQILSLSYSGPGIAKQVVPSSKLLHIDANATQMLEAELAVLYGARVLAIYPGYTGTGYADYQNNTGDYIEWTANVATAGTYNLTFKHSAPTVRSLEIKVNGSVINASLTFPATANLSTWTTLKLSANLLAGTNKIRATAIGTSGPNIDHLIVQKATTAAFVREDGKMKESLTLLPNPVYEGENLIVKVPASEGDKVAITMYNLLGEEIFSTARIAKGEESETISLSIKGATEGMYIIKAKSGEDFYSGRVFIRQQ
jgi:glucose/arabinose dehydrogenase